MNCYLSEIVCEFVFGCAIVRGEGVVVVVSTLAHCEDGQLKEKGDYLGGQ